MERLKEAYEAGYYRTEAAPGDQIRFPWQNKTCRDCPFRVNSICQVYAEYRSAKAHTCSFFDPWNRTTAQSLIQDRRRRGFIRKWPRSTYPDAARLAGTTGSKVDAVMGTSVSTATATSRRLPRWGIVLGIFLLALGGFGFLLFVPLPFIVVWFVLLSVILVCVIA